MGPLVSHLYMPTLANNHPPYNLRALPFLIFPNELFMLNHSSHTHRLEHIPPHSTVNLQHISIRPLEPIHQVLSWLLSLFLNMPLNSHT